MLIQKVPKNLLNMFRIVNFSFKSKQYKTEIIIRITILLMTL